MTEVSVIIPVHNAEPWLGECLQSVYDQTYTGPLELSVYNDASDDESSKILELWRIKLRSRGITVTLSGQTGHGPRGVGYAKNRAVSGSSGAYLCFLDADDVMSRDRIETQYECASTRPDTIIGSRFHRLPADSTVRYTEWANNLTPKQLHSQMYTSHGPTVIMPTWFFPRDVFDKVGGFNEAGKGTPEDLLFFYRHLELGGNLYRVDRDLLMYRYHPDMTTLSIREDTIFSLRSIQLQKTLLSEWPFFTIWNAGKQGRKLYRSLTPENQKKVSAFCDVDEKKIKKQFYTFEDSSEMPKPRVPIVHFTAARPPFVLCVKQNLTQGGFETNLASLNLTEGTDFIHFN